MIVREEDVKKGELPINKIVLGDAEKVLKKLPDNSIDAVVTDPPYGLEFMNQDWDKEVPPKRFWREVLRVMKPGAHLLSFFGTRTYHRGVVNIEDAGFEIRDMIVYLYGSGFPKGQAIDKLIDKELGAYEAKQWQGWNTALKPACEPIVLARKPISEKNIARNVLKWGVGALNVDACRIPLKDGERLTWNFDKVEYSPSVWNLNSGLTKRTGIWENTKGRYPANVILDEEAARMLDEFSATKDFSMINVSGIVWNDQMSMLSNYQKDIGNILESQKVDGILNGVKKAVERFVQCVEQGGCGYNTMEKYLKDMRFTISMAIQQMTELRTSQYYLATSIANCMGKLEVITKLLMELNIEDVNVVKSISPLLNSILEELEHIRATVKNVVERNLLNGERKIEKNGMNTTESIGERKRSKTISRFFYCAKAGRDERFAYCQDCDEVIPQKEWKKHKNHKLIFHTTVKPLKLMEYLVRLVTPPNGIVLDPFFGTGTTGIVCLKQGFRFIGIEIDPIYCKIAEHRLKPYLAQQRLPIEVVE